MTQAQSGKSFILNQLPAILCALLIFVGSSIPAKDFPDLSIFSYDKIIHFVLYLVLTLLTYRALRYQRKYPFLSNNAHWIALLVAIGYGAIDELHQSFVPGRDADPYDWLADSAGSLVCLLAVSRWARVFPGKDRST